MKVKYKINSLKLIC